MQAANSSWAEQELREAKAKKRAKEAHAAAQRRIKEIGKESALPYGQALFDITLEPVAASIAKAFEEFVLDPKKARKFAAVLPLFDHFNTPTHVAAVALVAVLDQLSRKMRYPTFCQGVGWAIERETRLIKFGKCDPLHLRRLTRSGWSRRQVSNLKVLREIGIPVSQWSDITRLQVGGFLVDHITQTGLFKVVRHRIGRTQPRMVVPSEEALEFIRNCPERSYRTSYTAMITQPRPWDSLFGGGLIDNDEPLVRVPIQDHDDQDRGLAHYRAADLTKVFAAVNHLQKTELVVSAEMVELQRIAWENGIAGLFPCSRDPLEPPPRLGSNPTDAELRDRNRLAAMCHRDREVNRPRRVKIERSLQAAEELAGRHVWQSWHTDYRGRMYAGNRWVTTQGQDHEKAQLSFVPTMASRDSQKLLLMAAAGHYGMSRSSWSDRLQWAEDHLYQMMAAADDPLNRLELWRDAADPWQFLQTCIGLRDVVRENRTGCPVRFDQTTSGCGILAALTRNSRIGRACNLHGTTPHDLYGEVAAEVIKHLKHDLEFGAPKEQALAHLWLEHGVDRSLCKGPVLAAPYGGSWMSIADGLVDRLDKHYGFVPMSEYGYRVAVPSKYMASVMWTELKAMIGPVLEVKAWLRKCTKKLMPKGHPLEWTTPMGWPMRIADRQPTTQKVVTQLYGTKISSNIQDQPWESPLSATQANKGIGANLTHCFDAAFAQSVAYNAAMKGIPLVANHDCFAVQAHHASDFHMSLMSQFQELYKPNWLMMIKEELEARSGIELPDPPYDGTLKIGQIGSNSYLFG